MTNSRVSLTCKIHRKVRSVCTRFLFRGAIMGVRSQQQKEEDGHSEGAASVDRVHSHCEELDASKWKNRKGGEKAIFP